MRLKKKIKEYFLEVTYDGNTLSNQEIKRILSIFPSKLPGDSSIFKLSQPDFSGDLKYDISRCSNYDLLCLLGFKEMMMNILEKTENRRRKRELIISLGFIYVF